ncbi:TetR/AcrR family transcriptional regulator [Marinobacter zhejiangensis]|uniref:Transcriptional regulator, TetR family n=1 Tax=Marinobacter zhejiangensis TaxID=488535 RepID=A0A1I4RF88_9GAMM|nr:TetR/AcrR family transcriptional regulator [Marinobacter zhejiangensis]SFM50921.1 transcriptional regulator, TetR family [Marinobacter zhejiangensis]
MDMLQTSPQLPGKRERNRINNRNAILGAARTCFRDKGYDNTTIRDIVRQTSLAAGTFYNYFASKQDIFIALLTDFLDQLNRNLSERRQTAESAEQFVCSTYQALFHATAQDPLVYELAHRNDQTIKELFGSGIMGMAMLSLEEDVRDAIDSGLLPTVDVEYLCASFFGVAYEMSLKVAMRSNRNPDGAYQEAERAARFAAALFLGGLERMEGLS